MSTIPHSECRKCGKPIYWQRSRAGKPYPTDSVDRRDFHKCSAAAQTPPPQPKKVVPPKPPITPDYFEATLEERVAALEKQLTLLNRTVQGMQARQPITAEDVGF